jgi:hypothetical protein
MADLPFHEQMLMAIKEKFKPGDSFTEADVGLDRSNKHTRQNALWMLYKKGYLDKPRGKGTKGVYILRGRRAPERNTARPAVLVKHFAKKPAPKRVVRVTPVQAIYDLLDFMAKAEPVLKRAAKILEAVENA